MVKRNMSLQAPGARALILAVVISPLGLSSMVRGVPPIDGLETPRYSFALGSPSVVDATVDAASVLMRQGLNPRVLFSATDFGLGDPADDLDALSGATMTEAPAMFILMFSVDALSFGAATPDVLAIAEDVPFNAWDQAWRGHQAGDLFMSCTIFESDAGAPTPLVQTGEVIPNNVLITNNYDEGGVDFAAQPVARADESLLTGPPQDTVDAAAYLPTPDFFFSTTRASPSLATLAPNASGADVFFADAASGAVTRYATATALGLTAEDDLDALIVIDADLDRAFGGDDTVFFSLAPGSPSLATLPGVSAVGGAADVFLAHAGFGLSIIAPASVLGLGSAGDNIDALEIDFCDGALDYARLHGIRNPGGSDAYTLPPSSANITPGARGGDGGEKGPRR